jgi:hypothetical protein
MHALSPVAKEFIAALPAELTHCVVENERRFFYIKSQCEAVGSLSILDEEMELTVCLGESAHSHFEVYCENAPTEAQRQRDAAMRALAWVKDIIESRIRFRDQFADGRLIANTSWIDDEADGGPVLDSTDEYVESDISHLALPSYAAEWYSVMITVSPRLRLPHFRFFRS